MKAPTKCLCRAYIQAQKPSRRRPALSRLLSLPKLLLRDSTREARASERQRTLEDRSSIARQLLMPMEFFDQFQPLIEVNPNVADLSRPAFRLDPLRRA